MFTILKSLKDKKSYSLFITAHISCAENKCCKRKTIESHTIQLKIQIFCKEMNILGVACLKSIMVKIKGNLTLCHLLIIIVFKFYHSDHCSRIYVLPELF